MNRRDVLRGAGAALGGAGAAAALLRWASGESTAQAALTLDVVGDHTTLGADESVAAVWLDLNVEWAYELPDGASPETVTVEIAAGTGSVSVVDSAESPQLFNSADGSESFETDLIAAGALDAAALEADEEIDVSLEARLRVDNGDGELLARAVAADSATVSADVNAIDPGEFGSIGGSGELRIETE